MLRRPMLALLAVLAVAGGAEAAPFVSPIKVLPGVATSCTGRAEVQGRDPVVAGSAAGPAVLAAFAPNCSIVAATRRPGSAAFGPPQGIGGQLAAGTEATRPPVVAVDDAGDAVVAWSGANGCSVAFAPSATGVFAPTEHNQSDTCLVALDGTGRVIVGRETGLVDRSPAGAYGPAANPFLAGATVVALAANASGDAVAVADSAGAGGGRNLQVAVRKSGGGWSAAVTLGTGIALTGRVSAAIDAAGGVVVVWGESAAIPLPSNLGTAATLKYVTGNATGAFGPPTLLPSPGPAVLNPRYPYALATNARGDATIVFAAITGPLSGAFLLSDRPAGASTFGPAVTIGTVRTAKLLGAYTKFTTVAAPVAAVRESDGTLVIVQGIEDVGRSFVQARVRPPGGNLGKPVWLSTVSEGELFRNPTEVAASAGTGGTPLVAWRGQQANKSGVFVSGASLGPAAVAGSAPPVTFSIRRVLAVGRSVGGRLQAVLKITIRSSRATLGTLAMQGTTVAFAVRAGTHTILASPFGLRTVHVRPGQRIKVTFDVAGAGAPKVVRTITLPR